MAHIVTLTAESRPRTGKGAARAARRTQRVPAVLYGRARPSQALVLDAHALEKALTGIEPSSTVITLTVDGTPLKALIREIQRHPVRPDIIHVDFHEIHAEQKVRLRVPVHLDGSPDGVRNGGGVLDQVTREVEIEVLPEHIPERVTLDVTALAIGHSLHVSDLAIANARILTPGGLTICTVVPPRAEEAPAVPGEVVAEAVEPELIRKEREEAEEGEAGQGAPEARGGKEREEPES
jgi:large subunit ribosomal protein L25